MVWFCSLLALLLEGLPCLVDVLWKSLTTSCGGLFGFSWKSFGTSCRGILVEVLVLSCAGFWHFSWKFLPCLVEVFGTSLGRFCHVLWKSFVMSRGNLSARLVELLILLVKSRHVL